MRIAVEDALSEAILRRLLSASRKDYKVELCYPQRTQGVLPAHSGWGALYSNRAAFAGVSATVPVIVLVDLDDRVCPKTMAAAWKQGLPASPNFLIRIAVREAEAWLLADFDELMTYLHVSGREAGKPPESVRDPKQAIVCYASKSRVADIRRDMVPLKVGSGVVGRGYSSLMRSFVNDHWNPRRAAKTSESLRRAIAALEAFGQS